MKNERIEHIKEFYNKVKKANKETPKREAFKDLLNRIYYGDREIEKVIDAITLGAETNIVNIPRKDKLHRGSADTLYNKVIIEYENDLRVSLTHAKEQLAGYLLAQFKIYKDYNFTLIATDLINWKLFSLDISCIDKLENLKEDELILNEIKSASFILNDSNADDFYFWIDRFLFKEEKQKATLKRIEEAFGYQSNVFIESFRELSLWFKEAKKYGEVQVSFEQWKKFLSIAYGSFDASEENFLIHTYLSVFSKILAYSFVTNDEYLNESEILDILDGSIFNKYNIRNFVDNDFFHWVKSDQNFRNLKKTFRIIAQEVSTFDFNLIDEDVLKGVYQELTDLDTRHSLGEYYTPDWLCQRITNEFNFKETDKILDPSCGSGSFLRASIHRMKELNPEITIENLSNQIYGIDIHPLSVQISKVTVLLTLGKGIIHAKKPIHLNVILANTLLAPDGVKTIFGGEFSLRIDKTSYHLNTQVLDDDALFDEALEICEDLANQTLNKKQESFGVFENILKAQFKNKSYTQNVLESFYKIYEGLKLVKESGRDSIWKFIVQNLYKPYFLEGKFDYVIGNPPWFTYSSIKNEEYQDVLNKLAVKYQVKPDKVANFPHLEIAAIFLAHCSNYFLKESGKLAFVLPRSFFSADHHDNTRSGKAKGFKLYQIWDLIGVSPLFRIPCCVLFTEKSFTSRKLSDDGLKGLVIKANLPSINCTLKIALPKIVEDKVIWFYSKQGKATAFTQTKLKSSNRVNFYKKYFRQGATIVPRSFYFVEFSNERPLDFKERILNIRTEDSIKADSKKPWKGIELDGNIESQFLFATALSKSILPFALFRPQMVVMPITIELNKYGNRDILLHSSNDLRKQGFLNASRWFQNVENIWKIHRTAKNKSISSENYLNWQNKLTEQNLNLPYLIVYSASAKDANAVLIERSNLDLEFLVESKGYCYQTTNKNEGFYLTGFLNSSVPNKMMKDFQTKGLFGARDVHKKILDVFLPKFNEKSIHHRQLAEISEAAHLKTRVYLETNIINKNITSIYLGRLRLEIKKLLTTEMTEIDRLVEIIIE